MNPYGICKMEFIYSIKDLFFLFFGRAPRKNNVIEYHKILFKTVIKKELD